MWLTTDPNQDLNYVNLLSVSNLKKQPCKILSLSHYDKF